jgi:hypothetical protein
MSGETYDELYESILSLDPKVRFVAILNLQGKLVHKGHRREIQSYLDSLDQMTSVQHALESWHLRSQYVEQIGLTKYAMAIYEKIRRYTVPIGQTHLLYITTEPDISHEMFMQDVLKLVETHKKRLTVLIFPEK